MNAKGRKTSEETKGNTIKAATISGILTIVASLVSAILGLVSVAVDLTAIHIPTEFVTVFAVVLSLIIGLTLSFYVILGFYRRQSLQTKMAVEKLRDKESHLFQELDDGLSSLLKEKV